MLYLFFQYIITFFLYFFKKKIYIYIYIIFIISGNALMMLIRDGNKHNNFIN